MSEKELPHETFIQRIKGALYRTWETIAYDIFECSKIANEDFNGVIPQDEVVEVVLDANYLETYGDDKEAIGMLRAMPYKEQIKIAKICMPYDTWSL